MPQSLCLSEILQGISNKPVPFQAEVVPIWAARAARQLALRVFLGMCRALDSVLAGLRSFVVTAISDSADVPVAKLVLCVLGSSTRMASISRDADSMTSLDVRSGHHLRCTVQAWIICPPRP